MKFKMGDIVYVYFKGAFDYLGIRKAKIVEAHNEQWSDYNVHVYGLTSEQKRRIKELDLASDLPIETFTFRENEIFKTKEEILMKRIGGGS